jgi:hypothetical protein
VGSHWSLLLLLILAACHRPEEIRGLYLSQDSAGVFFPCDDASMVMHVQDSALATSYHKLADSTHQPVFVRLRAVPRDSGSIYGGKHYLDVREVIEMRPRATGECPGIAQATSPLQTGTR